MINNIKIDGDLGLSRLQKAEFKAQMWLDNEVIKDTEKYVPFKTGILAKSAVTGSNMGKGLIIYNTPYARNLYYGSTYNFNKNKHPQAQSGWFEVSKSVNLTKWLNGVKKIGGGN